MQCWSNHYFTLLLLRAWYHKNLLLAGTIWSFKYPSPQSWHNSSIVVLSFVFACLHLIYNTLLRVSLGLYHGIVSSRDIPLSQRAYPQTFLTMHNQLSTPINGMKISAHPWTKRCGCIPAIISKPHKVTPEFESLTRRMLEYQWLLDQVSNLRMTLAFESATSWWTGSWLCMSLWPSYVWVTNKFATCLPIWYSSLTAFPPNTSCKLDDH